MATPTKNLMTPRRIIFLLLLVGMSVPPLTLGLLAGIWSWNFILVSSVVLAVAIGPALLLVRGKG